MFLNIGIRNFKCFESLSLPIAPLTLLTGFNASGKSTTLQSLLLLAQSLRAGNIKPELPLNGKLVRLGRPGEILNRGSGKLIFSAENESAVAEWTLTPEDRRQGVNMKISHISLTDRYGTKLYREPILLNMLLPIDAEKSAQGLIGDLSETIFLSALRIGTEDVFPSPEDFSSIHADVGVQGEFAPWCFHQFSDIEIDERRCNSSDSAKTLRRQFNAWAGEFFPGAEANTQAVEKTNLVRLELRIGRTSDWCRPANIGFGLTYAFPVIVAGLLAKEGQTLIIDSPEAHLHPSGQSHMGKFLAQMASAGVQIIVETHSDHILNGIRLGVRDGIISPEKTAFHFYNSPHFVAQGASHVCTPFIDINGNLSEWPEGFFDQSDKDMARLAGWV